MNRYFLNDNLNFGHQYDNYKVLCERQTDPLCNPNISMINDDALINIVINDTDYFGPGVIETIKKLRRERNLEKLCDG